MGLVPAHSGGLRNSPLVLVSTLQTMAQRNKQPAPLRRKCLENRLDGIRKSFVAKNIFLNKDFTVTWDRLKFLFLFSIWSHGQISTMERDGSTKPI